MYFMVSLPRVMPGRMLRQNRDGRKPAISTGAPGFLLAVPRPVRRRLGAVAAERHAAPAPCMGLGAVEEYQGAVGTLAGADQPEIRMADQIGDGGRDRLQQV